VGIVLDGTLEVDFRGAVERFAPGGGLVIRAGDGHKAGAVTALVRFFLFEEQESRSGQ